MTNLPTPMQIAPTVGPTLAQRIKRPTLLDPRFKRTHLTLDDAMARCRAAAALEIPFDWDNLGAGKSHGGARLSCACDLLTWSVVKSATTDGRCKLPRIEHCTLTVLRGEARNWFARESKARERVASETAQAAQSDLLAVTDAIDGGGLDETAAISAAERLATELDAPAANVALYGLLRDGTSAEVAADLSMSPAAYRQACKRALDSLRDRYPTPYALASALSLVDAPSAGVVHPHTAALPDRTTTPSVAPVIESGAAIQLRLPMRASYGATHRWRQLRAVRFDDRYRRIDAQRRGYGLWTLAAEHPTFHAAPLAPPSTETAQRRRNALRAYFLRGTWRHVAPVRTDADRLIAVSVPMSAYGATLRAARIAARPARVAAAMIESPRDPRSVDVDPPPPGYRPDGPPRTETLRAPRGAAVYLRARAAMARTS